MLSSFFLKQISPYSFILSGHHIQGLELAASSYHKVLEENRVLYNEVLDLKGYHQIFVLNKLLFNFMVKACTMTCKLVQEA